MSDLRRRSLKVIVPGAAALLVSVSALAAHASPAAAATGTVIEVQAAGPAGGPPSPPGVIRAPSVYTAETLAAVRSARAAARERAWALAGAGALAVTAG